MDKVEAVIQSFSFQSSLHNLESFVKLTESMNEKV